jgi:YHS domain-containing protein
MMAVIMVTAATTYAEKEPVFSTKDGAIRGYDPVAYFKSSKPVKGKENLSFEWHGATWHFASQENLNAFKADPEKYAPQFGGYCAYAVAKGSTAKTEPEAWKIVDGKLYLNYDLGIKEKWEANQADYIKKAHENWPGVLE